MPVAAVIFNPTKIDPVLLRAAVAWAEVVAGWQSSIWLETSVEDAGSGHARAAVEQGVDVVIGVGGDGTIRSIAEGLRGTGVPLALAPQGTGNLLARNLNLPLDNLAESLDTALRGVTRPIDLGIAQLTREDGEGEERAFLVMAGMGLDAQIMATTDAELKRRVGMLAYVQTGAKAMLAGRRMRLRYQLDDDAFGETKVHTVLIGNCGSIGGNFYLMPDAAVDDGVLDVFAVRPQGRFGWLRVARQLIVDNAMIRKLFPNRVPRRSDPQRDVSHQQARRVRMQLRHPEEIEMDGDHLGEIVALEVSVDPGGLLVRMPQGWSSAS